MTPMAIVLAVDLANLEARSALPNAPVVDDYRRESVAVQKVRGIAARSLRWAADRLDTTPAVTYG